MNPDTDSVVGIPEMENKYSTGKHQIPTTSNEVAEKLEKAKAKLEKLKGFILKKFPYTEAIGILPQQSIKIFIDEEDIGIDSHNLKPEEIDKITKKTHLYIIIPEEKLKETPKIKKEVVREIEKTKENIWIHVRTPVDVWEYCLDSKFDIVEAIAMSFPLYDKGILGSLRVAEIHKTLVLRKFDKYVVSYVIAGSFLRGTTTKTSDIDVFVVIDDTDVKRMQRLELKERLREQIYRFVSEALSLAGVKNTLHVQTYLLTEFWESVKDAHPVIFTFIRDGVPLHDRGTFMPWKTLLKMGKLKPSPESIDMFMKTAERTREMVDRRLIDAMLDIYYGVLTPSQALVMLYGMAPPTHKETPKLMEEIFVKKEKMLNSSDVKIIDKAVKLFKEYEHNPKKNISGKEIDEMMKDADAYMKRLKELRSKIEKRAQERTIEQIYNDAFEILRGILGKKSQSQLIDEFEKQLVKKGKFPQQYLKILKEIVSARNEFKKGKLDTHKIEQARRDAMILINGLIEFSQRADLANFEKSRIRLKFREKDKEKIADLVIVSGTAFLVHGLSIKKITNKVENSNVQEFNKAISSQKPAKQIEINPRIFELVKKEIGEYEIII